MTDCGAVHVEDFETVARGCRRIDFETYEFSVGAFGFLLGKCLTADKSAGFVEFYEHAESSLYRSDVFGEFIAI